MAYDKKKLYKQAIEAIEKNKLYFIEDLVAYLPCSKKTLYEKFKTGSNELHNIKEALEKNIIATKQGLKAKWYKSENASMSISLYKLLANDDERRKLSQQYHEQNIQGNHEIIIKDGTEHGII